MSKLIIRLTIILTAFFLIACYIVAYYGIDIWCQWYYLLFELCVCLCISKQGVYHCRFIKWTAYAILIEDTIATTDVFFDYVPYLLFSIMQPTIITAGLVTTTALAIRHYIKVRRIKKIWR